MHKQRPGSTSQAPEGIQQAAEAAETDSWPSKPASLAAGMAFVHSMECAGVMLTFVPFSQCLSELLGLSAFCVLKKPS